MAIEVAIHALRVGHVMVYEQFHSGVLCRVGCQCFGSSCADVGGAGVVGRSGGHGLPMPRVEACVACPVPIGEEDVSSDVIATSGSSVCPLCAIPMFFPEGDRGNV